MEVVHDAHFEHLMVNGQPYTGTVHLFWCPGCRTHMWFTDTWTWNRDRERPTVSPSIQSGGCHLFIRDGQLVFLSDSQHELAGRTVPMEEVRW